MDPINNDQEAVTHETVSATFSESTPEPSHTPPHTPPIRLAPNHPDKPILLTDTHDKSSPPPESVVFAEPHILTPPRVNGNRKPRSDTITSISGASSSLSTTDDDGTESSSENSDTELDIRNTSAATVDSDEDLAKFESKSCEISEDHPVSCGSDVFDEPDEYPDDDCEQSDAVAPAEILVADIIDETPVLPVQNNDDIDHKNTTNECETVDTTHRLEESEQIHFEDNSDCMNAEAETNNTTSDAIDIALSVPNCENAISVSETECVLNTIEKLHETITPENTDLETIHFEKILSEKESAEEELVADVFIPNINTHAPDVNKESAPEAECIEIDEPIEDAKRWSDRNGESTQNQLIQEELTNGTSSRVTNEDNPDCEATINEVVQKNDSDQQSDYNESDESSDADQSDESQSDVNELDENQSEMDHTHSQSVDVHNVEDMDLDEEEMPPQNVDITDEQTLSAPTSPQFNHQIGLSHAPSIDSPIETLHINEDPETIPIDLEAEPATSLTIPTIENPAIHDASAQPLNNNCSPPPNCLSSTPAIHDKPEELQSMIMSPPTFKSTDEMKYFLKHQLQFSDLGKLFGNVDVSSVMGSGQASDYAQYLGLQPSVKFKCFKCADSTFASLSELKQHQTKCLKQKLEDKHRQSASPRGSSTAGLRSSLNSDNAMDGDISANNNNNPANQSNISEYPPDNQQIDAKIRITRKVYLCSSCGTYYENWNLFFHMREVHQKFICLLCLGIFPSAERLVHHLEGKHNSRPDVFEHKEQLLTTLKDQCYMMCTVCEHIFSEHDDFTSHSCENYIKACALCGLKFIHKPQCKAGASGKALARMRKDKLKGKGRHKKLLAPAPNAAGTNDDAALDAGESGGLNFSNTLFGTSTSSINGIGGYNFELPQSILSNQTPDAPGTSYSVPPLAPEAPMSYLPQKLLQDDKPPEYPTNSSSSSVSSSSFAPIAAATNPSNLPRSTGNTWPTPIDNGYAEPIKSNTFNNNATTNNNGDPSQLNPSSMIVPSITAGKNISLFQQPPQQRDSLSISEDYLDNRDMEIIYSYINEFHSFSGQENAKNVSLTEIEPMQVKSPSPPPPVVEEPPRLVPKLKLNLSKAFQTPIESEESSTESDEEEEEEEEEEAAEEEGEDEEEEEEREKYKTPSNASRTPHPLTPHSFAPPSIPPLTPPQTNRSNADSDMQIDVELTPDLTGNQAPSVISHNNPFTDVATNDEDEDVNIEDEDRDSTQDERPAEVLPPPEPVVPFDGIYLADEDVPIIELLLAQPIDRTPILDFLRICIKATYPICLYCNHARKIAVSGRNLALHILAHHRFNATVDSITAEELYPVTIVQRIKSKMDELTDVFLNLDTFNTADPDNNMIMPKSFECFQCRFPARHHKDLYLHNRKMHLKSLVLCLMCKASFYSYSELSGHMCPGLVDPTANFNVQFRCVLCNLDRIPSAFRLMVHLRKKHGACDICLEYCEDQSRLSSHVCKHKLHHLCYRCGISYRNKADITKHLFWKHGTESQLCKKCLQKKWPHVYHFCVPPAAFTCEVCSKTFKRAVALKVHKRLHTEDHPYPCTEDGCEKKFISRKLLLKHVARHSAVDEPEPIPIVEATPVEENKPEEEVKIEAVTVPSAKPIEEEEKVAAPKPLIDIIKDLPAPNLSESDSSDESDNEQQGSRPASRSLLNPTTASAMPDEDEKQIPVAGIWDNFKSYQAKQTNASEDRDPEPVPPAMLHVSQSDHDYCAMYKKIIPESKIPMRMIPFIEIKQEPIDEDEVPPVVPASTVGKFPQAKLNKSPKKGRSPKKALDKSGSDSSSSDSDSSCSCGSNCSCSSSSDGSTSSSSSSSDADSSSSEGQRKKAEKLAKRRKSLASPSAIQKRDESTEHVDVITTEQIAKPNRDPDLIILESDLDTDESETDEEFYDEHPLRTADQLLADKRNKLMLQTNSNPLSSFDIVENSRPSTPSLPPAEEESKARKQKGKKRKKDRKNSKCVPSLKLNLASGHVSVVDESVPTELSTSNQFINAPQPIYVQPTHPVSSVAHNTDNLHRFTTNFPPQKFPANIKDNLKPRLSTGSSCSDADPSLKRSKRRRIPNKFYGYTSDEESTPTGNSFTNPMDAFKPQPPPNLTWCKEDLPQTPTIIRTPPIKTIIKLPTGLNNYGHSAALEYPSIENSSRFKSASPHLDQPPTLPVRHSQPPIPPIIIRPNRNSLQPPLVEPLRVPAVPVHHIVPPNTNTDADSDSSDSDSSNDGHLQIQQTPTPTTLQHTPQPFQRTPLPPPPRSTPSAKTPKPRAPASRKRVASRTSLLTSTPKAKRSAKSANTPKTPAIPAHYLPFMMDPQPAVPPPRPAIAHIPLAAMANQIRYPIMPPAGCRPARAGESVYCYCRCPYDEVSEMIACDGDNCPIEWFHFECVNIMVPPKGTWYCPQCRPKYPAMDDDDDGLPDGP